MAETWVDGREVDGWGEGQHGRVEGTIGRERRREPKTDWRCMLLLSLGKIMPFSLICQYLVAN